MQMNDSEIARLLFFTRAAAEADPAIAGSRIDIPAMFWFGRAWTQKHADELAWPPCTDITAPLSIAGIYRLWDDPETSGHCHRCDSKTLFLRLKGLYTPNCQGRYTSYCPFCGTDNARWPTLIGASMFRSVRRIVERIAAADAETPPGLPFGEALGCLQALRDADLLDPAHPLEAASLERAHAVPPVLTGHKARECEEAHIRAAIASPDLVARVAKARDKAQDHLYEEMAACEEELNALSGDSPESSPKARFKRGEMSREEYDDIMERMAILKDGADIHVGQTQIDDDAVSAAEAELGRSLSRREREVFIQALEDYMTFAERNTWKEIQKTFPVKMQNGNAAVQQ